MAMTKTDFERIACAIRDTRFALVEPGHPLPNHTVQIFDSLTRSVADVLAKQSGKFDRARFIRMASNPEF